MQKIGFLKEVGNEKRVSITSEVCKNLKGLDLAVLIEENAGLNSYISNKSYQEAGGEIVSKNKLIEKADILVSISLIDEKNFIVFSRRTNLYRYVSTF